jgi:DNA topoisomerase-2
MENKTLSNFYAKDYPAFGYLDNIRKIASCVDGLKLSQRKVIYTLFKRFNKSSIETKTTRLASAIAEATEYLHGEQSLCTVLDTMAANYTGSNNYPLVIGHGNFGTRFAGSGSASAPRYTYISIADLDNILYNPDDRAICKSQTFEGNEIEPAYYIPIFPVIFLNGIDGLSTGWKTQIFPRKPSDIIKYIEAVLTKAAKVPDPDKFIPYFRGFTGKTQLVKSTNTETKEVTYDFINYGVIEKVNGTELKITELPITYSYEQYIKVLERLLEKDIIVDYDDHSDPKTDKFNFTIKVKREFFKKNDPEDWTKIFGLEKSLPELLNLIDETNKIHEFNSIKEILDKFIEIRLDFYSKRKAYVLDKWANELNVNISKYIWCKGIIDETIKIRNVKKDAIVAQLEKIEDIVKQNDSYNYLLNMSLSSITKEKMEELKEEIKELKTKIKDLKSTDETTLWLNDLKILKSVLD